MTRLIGYPIVFGCRTARSPASKRFRTMRPRAGA